MTDTTTRRPTSLSRLRLAAMAATILTLIQAGLGIAILTGHHSVTDVHGIAGYANLLVTAVGAWFAFSYRKATGNTGLFMHALSLPILAVLQIGLAEMHQKWVHVGLGVAFLVAVVALYAMTDRYFRTAA